MKVMSAIESCRTAALGGHVARCEDCQHTTIAYNSCRNRHCPKCQGAAARTWMEEREAELLPVPYFHVVFTLPAAIGDIAYGLLAGTAKAEMVAKARELLAVATTEPEADAVTQHIQHCPCCGGRMVVIETFERQRLPRAPPAPAPLPGTQAS
jgi:Zn finger protein HypA/HybF involved in hydrogenase expression